MTVGPAAARRLRPRRRRSSPPGTATACPRRDFPMLIDLYLQGRLDLDAFVTETIGLDDVEEAFDEDAPRRRAALGGGALMTGAADRPRRHLRHVLPRRRDLRRRQQRLGGRRRRRVRRHRRAARRRRHPRPWSAAARCSAIVLHPRPRRPRAASRRRCAEAVGAPILLHPADRPLWELTHPTTCCRTPTWPTGRAIAVAGTDAAGAAHARATRPARSASTRPTSAASSPATPCSRAAPAPPAARFSDRDLIVESIRTRLLTLPDDTVVHTGHGDDTTIGAERADSFDWD